MSEPLQQTRREFLQTALAGLASMALPSQAPASAELLSTPISPDYNHLPRTLEGIDKLSETQRTLVAATTASGCESYAYYERSDLDGKFHRREQMDLYPTKHNEFPATATYEAPSEESLRAGRAYTIEVKNMLGDPRGLLVLQPPTEGYGCVKTPEQELDIKDGHEPLAARRAKFEMAEHIVAYGKNALLAGADGFVSRAPQRTSAPDKQAYFHMLREDFIKVLGAEGKQAKHVTGVSDLMMLAADVINKNTEKPIISEAQKAMLKDITVLHDVGKLQISTTFLNDKWPSDVEDKMDRSHYFMGQNHNHPLFTRLVLGAYPQEALLTAAHHHGVLRYADKELQSRLGEDYGAYKILHDNVAFDKLAPLSKIMRVCDVTEAMTGRNNMSVASAIRELANKAGAKKPVTHDCNSIDPDVLCTLIEGGLFEAYGKLRESTHQGWKDPNGVHKYNEAEVQKISAEVLAAFGWEKSKATALREQVKKSDFVQQNQAGRSL